MDRDTANTEAELERFRQQWREEVNERNRKSNDPGTGGTRESKKQREGPSTHSISRAAGPSGAVAKRIADYSEEVEPRAYHDLPDKEDPLRLEQLGNFSRRKGTDNPEPSTALEHYERAVEKETKGQLGDSLMHYRRAFKLDDDVHEMYKRKHFPPAIGPPQTAHAGAHRLLNSPRGGSQDTGTSASVSGLSPSTQQLVSQFADLRIEAQPSSTSTASHRRCKLAELPEEILSQILIAIALTDVVDFVHTSLVCKRLAYLVLTEEVVWRHVALGRQYGFAAMLYDYVCDVDASLTGIHGHEIRRHGNDRLDTALDVFHLRDDRDMALCQLAEKLLHTTYSSSWRQMWKWRPRLRFNGCYISTVNYTRPGATSTNTLTWGTPVLVVTYYRYLRFFRNGTVISLLTTSEPADVVHHLNRDNLHAHHHSSTLPSSVMKDALGGRWRLSSPLSPYDEENEGDVHVETEGVVPKYTYKLLLAMTHAGKGARNNKLTWKGFWSYNRLTDDWGEFGLKNDRAYYWSRVKSYGTGL